MYNEPFSDKIDFDLSIMQSDYIRPMRTKSRSSGKPLMYVPIPDFNEIQSVSEVKYVGEGGGKTTERDSSVLHGRFMHCVQLTHKDFNSFYATDECFFFFSNCWEFGRSLIPINMVKRLE